MPLKPNSVIWRTLLGASMNHNHLVLAEKAGKGSFDPSKAGLRNSLRHNRIFMEPELKCAQVRLRQLLQALLL